MMIKMARNSLLLAAFSSVVGCSSANAPVDIGDSRTGEKLEDYAAHWEGYIEANKFADGSDKVRLTLDASGNGTLEIGDSPALAPATDPDAYYPRSDGRVDLPSPGFAYSIHAATVESARIHFSSNPWEFEQSWCALQTSYDWGVVDESGAHFYQCNPHGSLESPADGSCFIVPDGQTADTGSLPISCARAHMCFNHICSCDAQGCFANVEPPSKQAETYTLFDAALGDAGESLVGTLKLRGKPNTVRLHRL